MQADLDDALERAQAALLARHAPDARVRRVRWSGGETQVFELGSGPPLVYVHGGLAGAYEIVPVLEAFARRHRVLAVDRPGHGLADPCDYRGVDLLAHARTFLSGVLDALELPAAAFVANSLGGLCSTAFALHAPQRVSRLALIGAPAGVQRRVPRQLIAFGLPLIGEPLGRFAFSRATRDGNRKFWGRLLVRHPERVDDLLLDYDVATERRNVETMVSLIQNVADVRRLGLRRELVLGDRWRALSVPTLMVWGEHDAFGSPDRGAELAAANPRIRLVRLADAGHCPWLDEPERVVAEVERFLAVGSPDGSDRGPSERAGAGAAGAPGGAAGRDVRVRLRPDPR